MRRLAHVIVILGAIGGVAPLSLGAQDGGSLFTDNCAPCHNLGEPGGAAPDLRDIATRRERAWLLAFVTDPASQDKEATMPPPGLSREAIVSILDYIDSRSSAPRAVSAPPPAPAFTPDDVARGEALFDGRSRFSKGGPACLSCHDAGSQGRLGGGRLGPNLARIATRLNGPTGTSRWLASPPTPVMRSLFGPAPLATDEVHALTAYFVDRVRPDEPVPQGTRRFIAMGVIGSGALLALIGALWRRRLAPVRRGLMARAAGGSR